MEAVTAVSQQHALRIPAPAWILAGAISTQLAGALAVHAFRQVGPVGIAWGRIVFAAIALVVATGAFRIARPSRSALRYVAVFGVALAAMNSFFSLAIDRIPLGPAVTIEFWGPIAVAIATSRRRIDLVWAALALLGVVLLGGGLHTGGETAGVAFALAAGACWIVYILVGRRVAATFEGATGLALAMVVAAVVLALHPAVAATVGALVLSQGIDARDVLAIAAVVAAGAGAMRSATVPPP
jgi:inner membrane transporter RhtA